MSDGWRYVSDHARVRAVERLSFEPSDDEWRDAALTILDTVAGRPPLALMIRRDGIREVWRVKVAHTEALVVWDPTTAVIVTVLPWR